MSEQSDVIDVVAPSFGESVTTAIVAHWSAAVGTDVKRDDVLGELETEKIAIQIASPADGRVAEILVEVGDTIEAGAALARVVRVARASAAPSADPIPTRADASQAPRHSAPPVTALQAPPRPSPSDPVTAGVAIKPALAASPGPTPTRFGAPPADPAVAVKRERLVRMTPLRQAVARRLKQAQAEAAILSTFNEVDMTAVMALREKYAAAFLTRHGVKLGFMSFFVRACISALREVPEVNTEIRGDSLVYKDYYDIGVAVGTSRGLVVPVVRNADSMTLAALERAIADLGVKAREGTLGMADLQGGTFTISNGGVYGSLMSTPIVNAPQSGILGMHKIQPRPVALDGQVVIRPMMYLALSYDHRVIDGKGAVTFLVKVKERVEAPERLLLDM
jgi:2-oxoglutarate dehydrogenase E2 component (dihydrolipoamide succinyltransferase)